MITREEYNFIKNSRKLIYEYEVFSVYDDTYYTPSIVSKNIYNTRLGKIREIREYDKCVVIKADLSDIILYKRTLRIIHYSNVIMNVEHNGISFAFHRAYNECRVTAYDINGNYYKNIYNKSTGRIIDNEDMFKEFLVTISDRYIQQLADYGRIIYSVKKIPKITRDRLTDISVVIDDYI